MSSCTDAGRAPLQVISVVPEEKAPEELPLRWPRLRIELLERGSGRTIGLDRVGSDMCTPLRCWRECSLALSAYCCHQTNSAMEGAPTRNLSPG